MVSDADYILTVIKLTFFLFVYMIVLDFICLLIEIDNKTR